MSKKYGGKDTPESDHLAKEHSKRALGALRAFRKHSESIRSSERASKDAIDHSESARRSQRASQEHPKKLVYMRQFAG